MKRFKPSDFLFYAICLPVVGATFMWAVEWKLSVNVLSGMAIGWIAGWVHRSLEEPAE